MDAVSGNTIVGPQIEDEESDALTVQKQVKTIKAAKFYRFLMGDKKQDRNVHLNRIVQTVIIPYLGAEMTVYFERFANKLTYFDTGMNIIGK